MMDGYIEYVTIRSYPYPLYIRLLIKKDIIRRENRCAYSTFAWEVKKEKRKLQASL